MPCRFLQVPHWPLARETNSRYIMGLQLQWLIIHKVRNCIDKSCPIHVHTRIQLLVNKADLECLVTEAMMLKEFLPKVLTPEYLTSFSKLTQIDQGA